MVSLHAHPVWGGFVAPPIKGWSLFPHPLNLGWFVTFFGQNDFKEVTMCWFWAHTLRRLAWLYCVSLKTGLRPLENRGKPAVFWEARGAEPSHSRWLANPPADRRCINEPSPDQQNHQSLNSWAKIGIYYCMPLKFCSCLLSNITVALDSWEGGK